jgi:hypothetical protein
MSSAVDGWHVIDVVMCRPVRACVVMSRSVRASLDVRHERMELKKPGATQLLQSCTPAVLHCGMRVVGGEMQARSLA